MAQKTYPLKIIKKIDECEDACTLVLQPQDEDKNVFLHQPAQFLSFHINIQGQNIIRSYSLSNAPILGEPLTTSIKKLGGGQVSTYLVDQIQENEILQSTKPLGKFFKMPSDLKSKHYFIIAGGSGITPLFSVIKTVLTCDQKNKVTLVYCNRKEISIIYRDEIQKWREEHADRFEVIHFLSRPLDSSFGFEGRLNEVELQKILDRCHKNKDLEFEYYLCGPIELMRMSESLLIKNNVDKKLIRKESFGTAKASKTKKMDIVLSESAVVIQADQDNESAYPETIQARLDGENIEISADKDRPILEQLIDAGYSPPFSCMEGACMTCMATLKRGKVHQDEMGILDEENIQAKEILSCQAKPLSRVVEVDYDS